MTDDISPPAELAMHRAGSTNSQQRDGKGSPKKPARGFTFWAIIVALCITSLLAAFENTVVATSLPTIVEKLQIGNNYVWITNVFFLTGSAVQPLLGQIADIFGRRWLAVSIVAVFTIGSAISGAANNGGTLIAGRAIQGVGSGGINMISDIIVSDLVPLRERGNFIAIILAVYSIGTSLGPFIGGIIVEKTTWRWVFFITLPFGTAATVLLFLFLRVRSKRTTPRGALKHIDFVGNSVIILSSISLLFALTYAESPYPWPSWRILVALILGCCGFFVLLPAAQMSRFCQEPVIPPRLFISRTSTIIYINTFINSMMLYWVMFFLPVYFQSVFGSSPARTGVQMLPIVLVAVPGAVVAVIILARFGKYRVLHQVGFAVATLGVGLFVRFDSTTPIAEWVVFQVIAGLGSGMILNTLLPAFQAAHPEEDQAAATSSWAFIRSFGNIWGVAIQAAIFNNRVHRLLHVISDPTIREALQDGKAYEMGPRIFKAATSEQLRNEIADVYSGALKVVWAVGAGFGAIAFLLAFFEKEIKLRTELETEYGLEEEK
ncbi:MFS general substrate transporter [Zopfia rhizophila CBS 207.26]|uniref:MFS general substrate transporter n=1 Tax=Zopfia rhizophila CBS 207.26 TaxID=1314779 RepID=A0A6A6E2Q4_9PEZI|nr:MFS general substrate transporter [Zopfia rhizophila CBS 207.26]